jgi:hypothetical protein
MPDISVDFRTKDYVTEQGTAVRSLRPFVAIQIGSLRPLCFLDTGAPFNIVSLLATHTAPLTAYSPLHENAVCEATPSAYFTSD